MPSHLLIRVRKISNEFEGDDGTDPRASSAKAADRCDRSTGKQIRRQNIGDGRKSGVTECRQGEQESNCGQARGEDGGNEQHHAESPEYNQRLASRAQRPATLNKVPRRNPAEEVAKVG